MNRPGEAEIGAAAFSCFMFSWVEVVVARTTVTAGKPITSLFGFLTDGAGALPLVPIPAVLQSACDAESVGDAG